MIKKLDNIKDCTTGKCKSPHKVDIMDTIKANEKLRKSKIILYMTYLQIT